MIVDSATSVGKTYSPSPRPGHQFEVSHPENEHGAERQHARSCRAKCRIHYPVARPWVAAGASPRRCAVWSSVAHEVEAEEGTLSDERLGRCCAHSRGWRVTGLALIPLVLLAALTPWRTPVASGAAPGGVTSPTGGGVPIKHVVVIFQENQSFDHVLGGFCVRHPGRDCRGRTWGRVSTGRKVALREAQDISPPVRHRPHDQRNAINGGKMNGFNRIPGCGKATGYACYEQYRRRQLPSLWRLARDYVISDRTFTQRPVASWVAHLQVVSATGNGFTGYNPHGVPGVDRSRGWGCDAGTDAPWRNPQAVGSRQPSCIPNFDGSGPFEPSPVRHVSTIMDLLEGAGLTWKIYAPGPHSETSKRGYGWAICPSFARCINTRRAQNMVDFVDVRRDARRGRLPSYSVVIPSVPLSQHNGGSMLRGDNWIASVVNAIGEGPDWKSTAIFITYDDCGCFYDHVPPPGKKGPRVPMVIVSPYARRSFTDRNTASFASILAYTERVFGLDSLGVADARAYDYRASFRYNKKPRRYSTLAQHRVPRSSMRYIRRHPVLDLD